MKRSFSRLKLNFGSNRGFSLIELSVVISVAASAAVGFLAWTQPSSSTNALKAVETHSKMKDIQKAIDSFRATKKRLPCPADPLMRSDATRAVGQDYNNPTATNTCKYSPPDDIYDYDCYRNDFGMEDLDTTQAAVNGTTTLGIDCPVSVGAVPVFSLGLDDSYINDAWGRRFTYHVASSICGADAGTATLTTAESERIGCSDRDYQSNSGNLTVTGGNTTRAAYILVSHGANGTGAYLPSGAKLTASVNANEIENSDGDTTYVKANNSTTFDDLVVFETKDQIESAVNRKSKKHISVADCEANSQALSQTTLDETTFMKSQLALTNYQQLGSNIGDQGLLGIMRATQRICISYYGATAATINHQTWSGAQCPGNQKPHPDNSTFYSTYNAASDSCVCRSGLWDGNCRPNLMAVAHDSTPFITIYNTSNWSKVANPVTLPTGLGIDTRFSPDGSLMAVAHATSPYITIYNTSDWSKVADPAILPTGVGASIAFSPDSSLMAVEHDTTPYLTIYNTSDWSKVANPGVLPNRGFHINFSPDGSFLAIAEHLTPYLTIYNTSDWSKVTNPAILPAGIARGVAFSPDSSLMAVSHANSPYITIYNTSDWSKVTDPTILPTGVGWNVTFSHDGSLMAVGHDTTPYLTIYNTSNWSKITDPATLPIGAVRRIAFSSDDSIMATTSYLGSLITTIYNTSDWSKVDDPAALPTGNGFGIDLSPF